MKTYRELKLEEEREFKRLLWGIVLFFGVVLFFTILIGMQTVQYNRGVEACTYNGYSMEYCKSGL